MSKFKLIMQNRELLIYVFFNKISFFIFKVAHGDLKARPVMMVHPDKMEILERLVTPGGEENVENLDLVLKVIKEKKEIADIKVLLETMDLEVRYKLLFL